MTVQPKEQVRQILLMPVEQITTDYVCLYRELSPLNYWCGYIIAWDLVLIHNLLFKVVEEQEHWY